MTEDAKPYSGRGGYRKGAGRKALGSDKRIKITINLPPETLARLEQLVAASAKSRSDIIVEALDAWFEKPENKGLME